MSGNAVHGSFVVPAGNGRNYKFDGILLAKSSSRKPAGQRWVEFMLYRSDGGTYVLARVGHSLLFHRPDCVVVQRNDLRIGSVGADGVPCELCRPQADDGVICPETPRHWAAMFEEAPALVRSLEREGESGRYITNVAARLMEQAVTEDDVLADAWGSVAVD